VANEFGDRVVATAERFKQTRWLDAVCQPDQFAKVMGTQKEIETLLRHDPDAFFTPPYAKPYEDWCVADFQASKQLDVRYREEARDISWQSYQAAWAWCPHPEFCSLVSDDVETIFALLLITNGKLRRFTAERMNWFVKGRVPWGYEGEFPAGCWVVI
jgi:hypothetical protein